MTHTLHPVEQNPRQILSFHLLLGIDSVLVTVHGLIWKSRSYLCALEYEPSLGLQALSNTVWALSKLEVESRDSALLDAVAAAILPALPEFNAQNIANTVRHAELTHAPGARNACNPAN